MMKKTNLSLLGAFALLGLGNNSSATTPTLPIAVADKAAVIEKLPEVTECTRRLEEKAKELNAEILKIQEQIQQKQKELQEKGSALSETKRKELEEEIQKLHRETQYKAQASQNEFDQARMKEGGIIDACAKNEIGKVAKEKDLLLVLDHKTGEVLYASDKLPDITKEVIDSKQKSSKAVKTAESAKSPSAPTTTTPVKK